MKTEACPTIRSMLSTICITATLTLTMVHSGISLFSMLACYRHKALLKVFFYFSQLEEYVTSSNLTITTFAHVFTAAGIYVFADSQNLQQQIIVNILAAGMKAYFRNNELLHI